MKYKGCMSHGENKKQQQEFVISVRLMQLIHCKLFSFAKILKGKEIIRKKKNVVISFNVGKFNNY